METYLHPKLGVLKVDTANGYDIEGADFVVIKHNTEEVIGYVVDNRVTDEIQASERNPGMDNVFTTYDLKVNEIRDTKTMKAALKVVGDNFAEGVQ